MSRGQHLGRSRRCSFIVRIDRDDKGEVSGVIERVRTGAKEPFHGIEAISALIARMVQAESAGPTAAPRAPGARGRRRSRPDWDTRP